jgi:hypothetical protein
MACRNRVDYNPTPTSRAGTSLASIPPHHVKHTDVRPLTGPTPSVMTRTALTLVWQPAGKRAGMTSPAPALPSAADLATPGTEHSGRACQPRAERDGVLLLLAAFAL